jgi:hypothetical protein
MSSKKPAVQRTNQSVSPRSPAPEPATAQQSQAAAVGASQPVRRMPNILFRSDLFTLQRAVGNHAVGQLLQRQRVARSPAQSTPAEWQLEETEPEGLPAATDISELQRVPLGGSPTSAPVATTMLQLSRHVATDYEDAQEILKTLLESENTTAMRGVIQAINDAMLKAVEKATDPDADLRIVCSAGGEQFDLIIQTEAAGTIRQKLRERVQQLAEAATEVPVLDDDPLTNRFNTKFRSILRGVREANPERRSSTAEGEHIDDFTTVELHAMFSSLQREQLHDYFETGMVPDHLFNGDDLGNANAQQRILLAAHILTYGKIAMGSYTQRIHARFCGHWVTLVKNYAGVAKTGGRGIENEFDHAGNVVMGGGFMTGSFEGTRSLVDPSAKGGKFRRGHLPFDRFGELQPGDWLYLFTGNSSGSGDHSVIFSHWLGANQLQSETGINYRKAVVFSQKNNKGGGAYDDWFLGDARGVFQGNPIYPITKVMHHDPESHTPRTTAEVEQFDLNLDPNKSAGIAKGHNTFLKKKHIDRDALIRYLQATNRTLLDKLAQTGRTTPGQMQLWHATNESTDLEVLVRLNERINNLIDGAEVLAKAEAAQAERIIPKRDEAEAKADIERDRLNDQIKWLEIDIARFQPARDLDLQMKQHRNRRKALRATQKKITYKLKYAKGEGRAELKKQLTATTAERTTLLAEIERLRVESQRIYSAAKEQEGRWYVGGGSAAEHIGRLLRRLTKLKTALYALEEAGVYGLTHPGRGFRSDEVMRKITGRLSNVKPQPNWDDLKTSAKAL